MMKSDAIYRIVLRFSLRNRLKMMFVIPFWRVWLHKEQNTSLKSIFQGRVEVVVRSAGLSVHYERHGLLLQLQVATRLADLYRTI